VYSLHHGLFACLGFKKKFENNNFDRSSGLLLHVNIKNAKLVHTGAEPEKNEKYLITGGGQKISHHWRRSSFFSQSFSNGSIDVRPFFLRAVW
jgi:beta-lactamase superfamily II metal-dependent hydrolase